VIFANHYLVSNAAGLLIIAEELVQDFKKLLIEYYEDRDDGEAVKFMLNNCYRKL